MYRCACVIVMIAVVVHTEATSMEEIHKVCRELSGAGPEEMSHHRQFWGVYRNSTCFLACVNFEDVEHISVWHENGRINVEAHALVMAKATPEKYGMSEPDLKDFLIQLKRAIIICSSQTGADFCEASFNSAKCLRDMGQ